MPNKFVIALLLLLMLSQTMQSQITKSQPPNPKTTAAIMAVFDAQRDAWNRGDVGGYMDGYERSADTVLVSGDSLTRGWQTVHDRYQKGYNTREKMGTLTFSETELSQLGKDTVMMTGRWHLKRVGDEPHGRFTLIFKRTKAGWRIVYDHTSSA